MVLKIALIIFYILVLYNFIFIEISDFLSFDYIEIEFFLFVFYLIIVIIGLLFVRFIKGQNSKIKFNLNYIFKSIFLLYFFMILGFLISKKYLISQNIEFITDGQLSGVLAFLYLSLGLLISPILIFIKELKIKLFLILSRRILGIIVFIIVLRHFIDFFQSHYPEGENFIDYFNYFIGIVFESKVLWTGTIGTIIVILLGLTSNNYSVGKLGIKLWKNIHFLVFPAYFFSALHIYYLGRIDLFYGLIIVIVILARIFLFFNKKINKVKKIKY